MRILVVMAAFNEVDYIDKNLRTLLPYVDKIAVSTTNHLTGYNSTDGTEEKLHYFIDSEDKEHKIIYRNPKESENYSSASSIYDRNEGILKTNLMNMMEPEEGDWIWIVDADEFYSEWQLERLRSRYLLEHQALQYNKHCLMVSAMVFAYNINNFYFSRHGRFFRYKKNSYFSSVNHFTWEGGEPVYGDKYGWDIPPSYLNMYHMRYVRSTIDRLRNRYIYRQDKAGMRKLKWFDEVYMHYPINHIEAMKRNEELCGARVFDSALGGKLRSIIDPHLPNELKDLDIDLWKEIRNEYSTT